MRKPAFAFILFSCLVFSAQAQIISEFTWDANPVTQAAIGPNGTGVSATATSFTGGNGGTNGLNAGTASASFFALGNFDFGISTGAIYVKLPLTTGLQTFNSISAVPATGSYRYTVLQSDGRTLQSGVFEIGNADQQISLNLSTAQKGMLFIRVQGEDAVASTFEVLRK